MGRPHQRGLGLGPWGARQATGLGIGPATSVGRPSAVSSNFVPGSAFCSSYNKNADIARLSYFTRLVAPRNLYKQYKLNNGGVMMFFHREVRPFSAYEIHTRIVGWNTKWIIIAQVSTPP